MNERRGERWKPGRIIMVTPNVVTVAAAVDTTFRFATRAAMIELVHEYKRACDKAFIESSSSSSVSQEPIITVNLAEHKLSVTLPYPHIQLPWITTTADGSAISSAPYLVSFSLISA